MITVFAAPYLANNPGTPFPLSTQAINPATGVSSGTLAPVAAAATASSGIFAQGATGSGAGVAFNNPVPSLFLGVPQTAPGPNILAVPGGTFRFEARPWRVRAQGFTVFPRATAPTAYQVQLFCSPSGQHGLGQTITNTALTSNLATYTTTGAHGFLAGDLVWVLGTANGSGVYNVKGLPIVSVPTTTTFTVTITNANVGTAGETAANTAAWIQRPTQALGTNGVGSQSQFLPVGTTLAAGTTNAIFNSATFTPNPSSLSPFAVSWLLDVELFADSQNQALNGAARFFANHNGIPVSGGWTTPVAILLPVVGIKFVSPSALVGSQPGSALPFSNEPAAQFAIGVNYATGGAGAVSVLTDFVVEQ